MALMVCLRYTRRRRNFAVVRVQLGLRCIIAGLDVNSHRKTSTRLVCSAAFVAKTFRLRQP
jgi:hypothetical protein